MSDKKTVVKCTNCKHYSYDHKDDEHHCNITNSSAHPAFPFTDGCELHKAINEKSVTGLGNE